MQNIVMFGAGHARFQCAAALRQKGFTGDTSVFSEERGFP